MYKEQKIVPIIFGVLIFASLSGFQFSQMVIQTAEAESSKRIVGYFPFWESGDIDSIDYSKLTDIIYFHIWPNPDGSLNTSAINLNDLNTITTRAHASGVTVSIAIGGWGVSDGFPPMAQDSSARANFVSNVENFVITNNLDGADIDWETPIDQTKIDNQDVLLSDLANTLHPLGKTVTVAANGDVVELKASAANSVDWVNLMAYDMNWNNAEHSTFDDSVAALQRYENAGIPKEKLDLGIPFYGRSDGWSSEMKYQNIVSVCSPQAFDNYCNGHFFNGLDLVQQKSQFVLDNGYDGIMIWNLGQDTYDGTSLLNKINEVFEDTPMSQVIAVNDSYSTNENTSLNVAPNGVLGNDSDIEGDPITAVLESNVSNGILILNPNGSFTYTPNTNFNGIDSFTYHATDGTIDSNTATVTITVNPVNEIPVAFDQTVFISSSSAVVTMSGSDADGDSLTFSIVSQPNEGRLKKLTTISPTEAEITYTQKRNPSGSDSFTFLVNDGTANSNVATLTITENSVNTPPVANNDSSSTTQDQSVEVYVLANDTDFDNDSLTIESVTPGEKGSVANNGGSVTYTPNPGEKGSDNFSYTINDGKGGTDTASVNVTISGPVQQISVHLGDLDGVASTKGPWKTATITITVHDSGEDLQSGVMVSGTWSGAFSGNESCTTDESGTCSVNERERNGGVAIFTITDLSGSGISYDSEINDLPSNISITLP